MSKVKVNELSKHDASEITVNDDVVLASGKSVSSPSISTDTISEKTSAAGVTIDGVLIKDGQVDGKDVSALTAGKILQVVQGTYSTQSSRTSSTHADTGLSVAITPKSTSSKILIVMLHHTKIQRSTTSANATVKLLRDSTEIESANHFFTDAGGNAASTQNLTASVLDSPSTTSEITYKTTYGVDNAANSETIYIAWQNQTDRLIAMEVGG